MIIYNVTVSLVDQSIHQDWLKWMKEIHIPNVLATGLFIENKIAKIHAEEEGGISYSIQYFDLFGLWIVFSALLLRH